MNVIERVRGRERRVRGEDRVFVQDVLVHHIALGDNRHLDWSRLDDAEAVELLGLVEAASEGGFSLGNLDGADRRRFESLVERVVGAGQGSIFEAARVGDRARREHAEKDAKARRFGISRAETSDLFAALYHAMQGGGLWADDVAIIAVVLAQLAAGRVLHGAVQTNSIEGSGADAAIVVDFAKGGLFAHVDGEGRLDNCRVRLDYLHSEGWLRVTKSGQKWTIALGSKLVEALGGHLVPMRVES